MKKNILFVLVLSWFLAGCATEFPVDGDLFGANGIIGVPGCVPYAGPVPPCSGDENNPKLTIDLDTFDLVPKCVNVKKGKTLVVELLSSERIDRKTVVLFPKDPQNYLWFARTNLRSRNKIKIKVPKKRGSGAPLPAGVYNYGISYKSQCLDPRVNVKN